MNIKIIIIILNLKTDVVYNKRQCKMTKKKVQTIKRANYRVYDHDTGPKSLSLPTNFAVIMHCTLYSHENRLRIIDLDILSGVYVMRLVSKDNFLIQV